MTLQKLMMGVSTRIIYKSTDLNGYVSIVIGCGITILVQSSSITTSVLTPLVGLGAIRLEQMFPLALGANIGTTVTGLLASLVSDSTQALQVALAHLFFNVTGILIFYPIPYMRKFPLGAARRLGRATRIWRGVPLLYILTMFLLVPFIMLGISFMFEQGSVGLTVMGVFVVVILFFVIAYTIYNCKYQGGQERCLECIQKREVRRVTMNDLPDDMVFLKAKIAQLIEHTGLPDDEMDQPEAKNVKKEMQAEEEDEYMVAMVDYNDPEEEV